VVALAAIALVLPPQSPTCWRPWATRARGSVLPALALLTFSGWYWTRALIAAALRRAPLGRACRRCTADDRIDPYAYDAVPWLVFFLTFLLGLGLILRSGRATPGCRW
jgi:hypothetical protein